MRRFVLLVVAGWVSAVALADCSCVDTNNSTCNRRGNGRAMFKWVSDQNADSGITLTAGTCGQGGESGKAYISFVCDTHSNECQGKTVCDDGYSFKETVAVIKVSGDKTSFKNTLGGLGIRSDKTCTCTTSGGECFYSTSIGEAGCDYVIPLQNSGKGHLVITAGGYGERCRGQGRTI
jgi:hypothetical protein